MGSAPVVGLAALAATGGILLLLFLEVTRAFWKALPGPVRLLIVTGLAVAAVAWASTTF